MIFKIIDFIKFCFAKSDYKPSPKDYNIVCNKCDECFGGIAVFEKNSASFKCPNCGNEFFVKIEDKKIFFFDLNNYKILEKDISEYYIQ